MTDTEREDFSQIDQSGPSINRKGGIRLHPIRDGVIPLVAERNRVQHRDRGGNKLTDVTNMHTGYCVGVTSPLMFDEGAGPVLDCTPVVPVHNPKRDGGVLPQLIGTLWVQGTGSNKHVIRTEDMGDKLIPSVPSRRRAASRGKTAQRSNDGPERASRASRAASATAVPTGLVDAYIMGMHRNAFYAKKKNKGKTLPKLVITKEMRRYARLELARQADIRAYCKK